jgi:2-keto-4-pentenoate hydratase/2-oxohepta-3-ene-1,7-dioic acid hydratase in catechol pathway
MLRLLTFSDAAGARPALALDDRIVALPPELPGGPGGLLRIIETWPAVAATVRAVADDPRAPSVPATSGTIGAPLQYPGKLLATGANYVDHTRGPERKDVPLREPFLFLQPARHAIVGAGAPIVLPPFVAEVDGEVELAVIIGRTARRVAAADALEYVFGYTILNDITSRRAGIRDDGPFPRDFLSGKGLESFCPMGPYVIPKEDLPLPAALSLELNGEIVQAGTTASLRFDIPALIAYASARITLDPGDVIATGSPANVPGAHGRYLADGDVLAATVAGIGTLRNPVRAGR